MPEISLVGSRGYRSDDLNQLTTHQVPVFVDQGLAPLFDMGKEMLNRVGLGVVWDIVEENDPYRKSEKETEMREPVWKQNDRTALVW